MARALVGEEWLSAGCVPSTRWTPAGCCRSTWHADTLAWHGDAAHQPWRLRAPGDDSRCRRCGWSSRHARLDAHPLAPRPPGHAGAGRWLGLDRRRRAADRGRPDHLGGPDGGAAGGLAPSTPSTIWAAPWSRPAWSTATPTWSTAATARPSSNCACRAPATSRSPAPAAASAAPWRPPARPATTPLLRQRRSRARA
jgi:hypothetical protein